MKRLTCIFAVLLCYYTIHVFAVESFAYIPTSNLSRVDTLLTINSLARYGNFWVMDYVGDYEDILQYMNNLIVNNPSLAPRNFNCSMISTLGSTGSLFMGRNFDNDERDVLVARYRPPGQYASIALNRFIDLGLHLGTDYLNMTEYNQRKLLNAPYFAADGINECGLSAGLAYVPSVTIVPDPQKEYIFITLLQRRILDQAATCAEALAIANSYNVFDNGINNEILSHHLLVTDQTGTSVILEYVNDQFVSINPSNPWQVLTNSAIYNVSHTTLMNLCWRYAILHNALEACNGIPDDWRDTMDILSLATWSNDVGGTQWSTIADILQEGLYISIDRDFDNIAFVDLENFNCLNYGNIYLEEALISDSDGDFIVEPGETVNLSFCISADFPTYNLTGTISTDFPGVIISNGSTSFPDLLPNQLVSINQTDFSFTIPASVTESAIPFTITVSTDYGHEVALDYDLPVGNVSIQNYESLIIITAVSSHPNPFSDITRLNFTLVKSGQTDISIYNTKGQKIKTLVSGSLNRGSHSIDWNGKDNSSNDISPGIYLARINQGSACVTQKLILIR